MMRIALLIVLGGVLLVVESRPAAEAEPVKETSPAVSDAKQETPAKEPAAVAKEQPTPQKGKPAPTAKRKEEVLLTPSPPPGAPVPVKSRMVRVLLDALEGIQGLEPEHKDGVARSLLAADEELSRVLGGNSKRLILRANRKPPMLIVGERPRPVLIVPDRPVAPPGPGLVPPPLLPPVVPGTTQSPAPAVPGPANSSMVQSLLKTLDGMQGEDPQAKEELRKMLLETDKKLNQAANDKP